MAAPKFDFRTYHEEIPAKKIFFAPMRGGEGASSSIYVSLGLALSLLVTLLGYRLFRRQKDRRREQARWARVHAICAERKLSSEDRRIFLATLQEICAEKPELAAESPGYFQATIAPELKRRAGETCARRIALALFCNDNSSSSPPAEGTRNLSTGQKMHLHFEGIRGSFLSTIITIDDNGLVVTLPAAGARHLRPRQGASAEAYLELGDTQYAFTCQILEVFLGGVFACRLSHNPVLNPIHQHEVTRVPPNRTVPFGHLAAAKVPDGRIDFTSLQSQIQGAHEGRIRDISLRGCSLTTPISHLFEVGDFIRFSLQLLEDEPPRTILATVVHVAPITASDGGGATLHLQFLALDEETTGCITRTVHRLR